MSKVTSEHGLQTDGKGNYNVLTAPWILNPNEVCTQSYLIVGISDSKNIATNFVKYYKAKFVRALILTTLSSISLNPDSFQFVPMQNFKPGNLIDWSKPISDINKQLYKMYNLSQKEIDYIEDIIKPME